MKNTKNILFGAALGLFFIFGILGTSCSKWTQPEAKDFYEPPTQAYKDNLKDYFNSPHKVMFGWFGNWGAGTMSNSLMGLPDSVDFVSLWLVNFPLSEAQQKDLKAFQERGSKAVLCWRAGSIGAYINPAGEDAVILHFDQSRAAASVTGAAGVQHPHTAFFPDTFCHMGMAVEGRLSTHCPGFCQHHGGAGLDPIFMAVGHKQPHTAHIVAKSAVYPGWAAIPVTIAGDLVQRNVGIKLF